MDETDPEKGKERKGNTKSMSERQSAPLIGLTPLWDKARQRYWMFPDYMERIRDAGGIPVILPMCDSPEEMDRILQKLDGILFTGGPDIDPVIYGSYDDTGTVDICAKRDAFELPLMRRARELQMPTLCICRGIQILNVALGGTVYEDIPAQYPTQLNHMQQIPFSEPSHIVTVESGTVFSELVDSDHIWVNSCHHQAIRRLADELIVVARSSDGLIEAVELPGTTFCMGVQWHPERLPVDNSSSKAIFKAFIASCR